MIDQAALDEIRRLAEAATQGAWRWEVNLKSHVVELCGGKPDGLFDKTIISFKRWEMGNAAPVFWFWQRGENWSEKPKRADELAVPVPGREHHRNWFATIDHPDAKYIERMAPPTVLALLDALEEARRERDHYRRDVGALMPGFVCEKDSADAALAERDTLRAEVKRLRKIVRDAQIAAVEMAECARAVFEGKETDHGQD